jgi:ribosomal protein L37AE/L43A
MAKHAATRTCPICETDNITRTWGEVWFCLECEEHFTSDSDPKEVIRQKRERKRINEDLDE